MSDDNQVNYVRGVVSRHMEEILTLFKRDAKITVLVRLPGNDEADFLLSNDTLEGMAGIVERSKTRPSI